MSNVLRSVIDPVLGRVLYAPLAAGFRPMGGGAFDPLSLFATGEVGVYYAPSDMSTLFQDRAGTTPVTAAGQPVGLMLDKSQGLVLGPELVTNGDFSAGATGWALGGTWAISGGVASCTTNGVLSQNIALSGTTVEVEFDLLATNGSIGVTLVQQNGLYATSSGPLNAIKRHKVKLIVNPLSVAPYRIDFSTYSPYQGATIDNISVRELPGNHASQPTAGKRPLLQSTSGKWWLDFDVIDDELIATFPSSLGSACTIGKALNPASTIVGAQTIGTTYTMNADNFSTVITNDALTADETAKLQTWLDKKAGNV